MQPVTSAVEQYFSMLIGIKEAQQILVSDKTGRLIVAALAKDTMTFGFQPAAEQLTPSNAIISAARALANLEQVKVGQPNYFAAQYHDQMSVSFVDGSCIVTIVGQRSHDQCIGGLIGLIAQIRSNTVFQEMSAAVDQALCF
jgi:hypothetical protein